MALSFAPSLWPRPTLYRLALVICVLGFGCSDCGDRGDDIYADGGPDADGGDLDGGNEPAPIDGPTALSSPGQIVPLLWGREVELHDDLNDKNEVFRLDDPSQPVYQRFFTALDAACLAESEGSIRAQVGISLLPGCDDEGAYFTRLHRCRAEVAAALVAGNGAGLLGTEAAPRLNLPDSVGSGPALWSALSNDSRVRASFALWAVAELREAIASASDALDPARCPTLSARNAATIAGDLREASESLENRSQIASGLLRAAWLESHQQSPDEPLTRIRATRDLNHSLLEEQKLYAGIPYAAFTPIDASEDDARDDRYPVLLAPTDAAAERAATLLSVSTTRFIDQQGKIENDERLGTDFVAALRAHEPFLLGHLPRADLDGILTRLDLTMSDLRAGAGLLSERVRLTGAPITPRDSVDANDSLAVLHDAARAPQAYVHAVTGARATRDDDSLAPYARRGLYHALDAARLSSARALERSELPSDALADLTALSSAATDIVGTLRVCEEEAVFKLEVQAGASLPLQAFELFSGEVGAACALDEACDDTSYRVPAPSNAPASFELSATAPESRYYLTARISGSATKAGRAVVASISTAPFDRAQGARCFFEPLAAAMHQKMRDLHERDTLPSIPRKPFPFAQGSALTPSLEDPVSLGEGRILTGRNALSEEIALDLAQPFSTPRLMLNSALGALCTTDAASLAPGIRECGKAGLARAAAHACRAEWAQRSLENNATTASVGGVSLKLASEQDRLSLRLFAWQEAQRAQLGAADVLDSARCIEAPDEQTLVEARSLLSETLASESDLMVLLEALEAEAEAVRNVEANETTRRILRTRALTASRLASARLLMASPRAAYEPPIAQSEGADPLDHALSRFPVVTRVASLAEDARAERLLRESELQPWLSDLTVFDGLLDTNLVEDALSGSTLATRLRTRLAELDPDTYGTLPSDPFGFLVALGVSSTQLRDAAVRIGQTAEIRGLSLLPRAASSPLTSVAMRAAFPAPNAITLSALGAGKLQAARDALPHHFALRGHYHVLSYVAQALARAHPAAQGPVLDALRAELASRVEAPVAVEQHAQLAAVDAIRVERTFESPLNDAEVKARIQVVLSDSGLSCVLTGEVAGEVCDPTDYLLDASDVTVSTLSSYGLTRRVSLAGYRLPSSSAIDWTHAHELTRGRVYVVEQTDDGPRALGGATLAPIEDLPTRHELPRAGALDLALLELLAFKAPGEGCAACRPRSICETTRCELDLCVREPVANGKVCGAQGICEEGVCSVAGCGDGVRADGTEGVPYEACDDGNLSAGDGCDASCFPELRSLEPLIEEGFPSGPAPAVAVDGLGQQLLVYTADALTGDNQLIRAAVLDAFGVQAGSERTIDNEMPRVFIAEPSVAGLRAGGFAVVYGSPNIAGEAGIGVRIVSSTGVIGPLLRVDEGFATAGSARVASVEDGFVVVWSERRGSTLLSRVRARRFDAQGAAIGSSFEVAGASNAVDQVEPTVASSLGQILIAWSERESQGNTSLGIRARRFFPFGSPVDANAFTLTQGNASEPSLTVVDEDYLAAWTTRDADASGDIARRRVQRFGLPLASFATEPWVAGAGAQTRPVVASLAGDGVLAYQSGSPFPFTALATASSADQDAADTLASALALARERDVSAVSTPLGVWFVWSERQAQGRALFAYLLPSGETP